MSQKPKIQKSPHFRTPVHRVYPESHDTKQLRLHFGLLDFDHHLWGWKNLTKEQYINFFQFVRSIEKQTWAEIKTAAGGKRCGTNHHPLDIEKFDKKAKKRLEELNLYSIVGDSLFSLRINNVTRMYGIRDAEFFSPIWHDPYHDQRDKAAYPLL
jgi:hypothetical protein